MQWKRTQIKSFVIYLAKIIFKISWVWNLEGYIFEKFIFIFFFYHLKTLGWTSGFCAVDNLPRAHWDETEFIVFQHVLKCPEVSMYQWLGSKQDVKSNV